MTARYTSPNYGQMRESACLETLRGWETLIDHAQLFGTDIVSGFTGRLRGQPIDASLPRFKAVFEPLARRAAGHDVRLAFENCRMEGNLAAWKRLEDTNGCGLRALFLYQLDW